MIHTAAKRARAAFVLRFGTEPQYIAAAPGRVNLIGEHTDYNDGFCLPCAIDRYTCVAISSRGDGAISVVACDENNSVDEFDGAKPIERTREALWANYVRGTLAAFQRDGFAIKGANIVIAGDVPRGAGLSSSASLEMAVAHAFKWIGQWNVDAKTLALAGQFAEHAFVDCQCGIMDQMISVSARSNYAMLLDCRSLQMQAVPLPEDVAIVIVNSKISRGLVDSEYNARRAQCYQAAKLLGVPALRDASDESLRAAIPEMEALLAKRARHVVSENARTVACANALAASDLFAVGQLMRASHASLRDDFEVSVPAIDRLVDLLADVIGDSGGARMTGGGFGGCVVALCPVHRVEAVHAAVAQNYRSPGGECADIYLCRASDGAEVRLQS